MKTVRNLNGQTEIAIDVFYSHMHNEHKLEIISIVR